MKKYRKELLVFILVFLTYVIGVFYMNFVYRPFYANRSGGLSFIILYTQLTLFSFLPLVILATRKIKNITLKSALSIIISMLPIQIIFKSFYLYTHPYVCETQSDPNYTLIFIKYFTVALSILIIYKIITKYAGFRIVILGSLIITYIIDLLIIQGWLFAWLR